MINIKKQIGSVSAFAYGTFNVVPAQSGTVTLTDTDIEDLAAGDRLYRAALVIRTDGTTDQFESTTQTQINGTTDWIIPNGDANGFYEVKYELDSGDALDASTSISASTWEFIGSDTFFEQRWASGAGIGGKQSWITVSIRYNGGSVLDSGSYMLHAERLF